MGMTTFTKYLSPCERLYMKETLGYICLAGFIISVLYALYAMYFKKSKSSTDGRGTGETGLPGRVKESSRILESSPQMTRPTESDIEVEPVSYDDQDEEDGEEEEEDQIEEEETEEEFEEYREEEPEEAISEEEADEEEAEEEIRG